jgi:asparagine synthase (glutamine-hydrolysing)
VFTEHEALEELGPLLDETIRMHLVADVPVGVFLSGGIDSSAVVAVMRRIGVRDIKTFSVGYDSRESELDYARMVAQHCGTEHHEVRVTPARFSEIFPRMTWHMDEPVADPASIPLFSLSEFARQNVTVALSGEGADEIFGGYPIYWRMLAVERINRVPFSRFVGRAFERWAPPGKLRKNGAMLGRPLESRYRSAVIFSLEEIARLLPDERRVDDPYCTLAHAHARIRQLEPLARMAYIDLTTWTPDDLLLKADRMSMAHSLELRVPFLDHKLVEFASRLPLDLKIHRGVGKYLLKRHMEPLLPSSIVSRPKRGFPVPTKRWFRGDLAGFAQDRLLATDSPCADMFPRREITRVLDAHRYRDCSDQIYALLVLDQWHRTFIRPRPSISASFSPLMGVVQLICSALAAA